jgi:hypothetical protein
MHVQDAEKGIRPGRGQGMVVLAMLMAGSVAINLMF